MVAWNRVRALVAVAATAGALTLLASPAFAAPPANDNFSAAQTIGPSTPIASSGTNVDATHEAGEPVHGQSLDPSLTMDDLGGSAWFSWTPDADGTATIDTCGTSNPTDTLLGVYTGSAVNSLTLVAASDDDEIGSCGSDSKVQIEVDNGVTYRIAVDTLGIAGAFNLNVALAVAPSNDDFADAGVLTGVPISVVGNNVNGTLEAGEPSHGASIPGGSSVWYTWTAPAAGTVLANLCQSNFDTILGVYTGSSVGALSQVAFNDDDLGSTCGGEQSALSFTAVAGTAYKIEVDGNDTDVVGDFTLKIDYVRQTTITTKPPKSTTKRTAKFAFKASPAVGAKFKCKLDGQPFKNCTSPTTYRNLKVGKHTLKVQASGDPTPASYGWTVKKKS